MHSEILKHSGYFPHCNSRCLAKVLQPTAYTVLSKQPWFLMQFLGKVNCLETEETKASLFTKE